MKPKVPVSKNFFAISELGRKLCDLQLNYEQLEPFSLDVDGILPTGPVQKLRLHKDGDRWSVSLDGKCRLVGIPPQSDEFRIFGRTPLEWVLDRYQVTLDKESGLSNDPNAYAPGTDYVIKLIGKAVTLGMKAAGLLKTAPSLDVV